MNDDQFDKLFRYMQAMKTELSGEMADLKAELKSDLSSVQSTLDRHSKFLEDDEVERLSLGKQVDRHEDWISRAAPAVNVRYSAKG